MDPKNDLAGALAKEILEGEFQNVKKNSFLVIKVGSAERPATAEDIKEVQTKFAELGEKFPNLPIIVTHRCIDVQLYTY